MGLRNFFKKSYKNNMRLNLVILDDFYVDAMDVRKMALGMEFGVRGNYPGQRTVPMATESAKEAIQKAIKDFAGEITYWGIGENSYNGAFQYTTSRDRSWIHADQTTTWAAVCYLTPDAPLSGGTGLFKHKRTGLFEAPKNSDGSLNQRLMDEIYKDSQDMTKWELVDFVGNKFNRLVLYRGDLFHTSMDYFGQDMNDGRLFQTFFFSTER
jgi:hypothetical protein